MWRLRRRPLALVALVLLLVPGCREADATLTEFMRVGFRSPGVRHAELGTPAAQELYRVLESMGDTNLDRARAALDVVPAAGQRGFAFVLTGCTEDTAVLTVEGGTLTADATGGDGSDCAGANYFLATFTVDRNRVPPSPVLKP